MRAENTRAQLTVETIFGIAVLLTLLLFVVTINLNREAIARELDSAYTEGNECNRLALTISLLYSEGPCSRVEFSIGQDAVVESDYVIVGETRCDFPGRAQSTTLSRGEIIAKNSTGVVVLENK